MIFLKQRYGVSLENSWNKYQHKYKYYDIGYRNYLLRKPTTSFIRSYQKRKDSLKPYVNNSLVLKNIYEYWEKKEKFLSNNSIKHLSIANYGPKYGVIVEQVISTPFLFKQTEEYLSSLTWYFLRSFENHSQKRWKVVSYLHNDTEHNHIHLLFEPFLYSKTYPFNGVNVLNYKYYINTKSLEAYKEKLNHIELKDEEYKRMLLILSKKRKIRKFLNKRKELNDLKTFLKSKQLYYNFEKNIAIIQKIDNKEFSNEIEKEMSNNE